MENQSREQRGHRPRRGGWGREPGLHKLAEVLTGLALGTMMVFGPWAFATVHPWSIWTMNVLGYILGFLLLAKLYIRRWGGYSAPSFAQPNGEDIFFRGSAFGTVVFILGAAILAYTMVAAVNSRSTFDVTTLVFTYRGDYQSWLPHSYDPEKSWEVVFRGLALLLAFLALIDWLLGLTKAERGRHRIDGREGSMARLATLPGRLKGLLILFCVSSSVLALVGILQRFGDNRKLLWLCRPYYTNPESHFGAFAYRGNASTFFNLAWPICIFLLLQLRREEERRRISLRVGQGAAILLYPCLLLVPLVPLVTTSRAGVGLLLLGTLVCGLVGFARSHRRARFVAILATASVIILGCGYSLGTSRVVDRLANTLKGDVSERGLDRFLIYEHTVRMIQDHPVFGTGPGSFGSVYLLYRQPRLNHPSNDRLENWAAWAHSDPLEMVATYGIVGSVFLLLLLACVMLWPLRSLYRSGMHTGYWLLYLALCNFVLNSFIDFPFHVYGLVASFVFVCGMLVSFSEWVRYTEEASSENDERALLRI